MTWKITLKVLDNETCAKKSHFFLSFQQETMRSSFNDKEWWRWTNDECTDNNDKTLDEFLRCECTCIYNIAISYLNKHKLSFYKNF